MDADSKKWDIRYIISIVLAVVAISASWFAIIVATTKNSNKSRENMSVVEEDVVETQRVGNDTVGYLTISADWQNAEDASGDEYDDEQAEQKIVYQKGDEYVSLQSGIFAEGESSLVLANMSADVLRENGYSVTVSETMVGDKSGHELSYIDGSTSLRTYFYYFVVSDNYYRILEIRVADGNADVAASIKDSWSMTEEETPEENESAQEETMTSDEEVIDELE